AAFRESSGPPALAAPAARRSAARPRRASSRRPSRSARAWLRGAGGDELDPREAPLADLVKVRRARAHREAAIADPLAVQPDGALVDEPEGFRRARYEAGPLQQMRDPELVAFDQEFLELEIVRGGAIAVHLVEAPVRALRAFRIVE